MNKRYEKLLNTRIELDRFTYQWVWVRCGNIRCKNDRHGPYLYARWRVGSKVKSIYLGRYVPEELDKYVTRI